MFLQSCNYTKSGLWVGKLIRGIKKPIKKTITKTIDDNYGSRLLTFLIRGVHTFKFYKWYLGDTLKGTVVKKTVSLDHFSCRTSSLTMLSKIKSKTIFNRKRMHKHFFFFFFFSSVNKAKSLTESNHKTSIQWSWVSCSNTWLNLFCSWMPKLPNNLGPLKTMYYVQFTNRDCWNRKLEWFNSPTIISEHTVKKCETVYCSVHTLCNVLSFWAHL